MPPSPIYFGGKRRVAAEVWRRFGAVRNYVEPFFGSGAVLLSRPVPFSGVETVNDADGLLCNFWRAVQADPDAVARAADWPVSECDLHARHAVLVELRAGLTERLMGDPLWYDAEAAGWWVWGACAWIGSGWCSGDGPWVRDGGRLVLGNAGQGINRKLPHLGDAGRGINRQLPHLGDAGRGINRQGGSAFRDDACGFDNPAEWLRALSWRLRSVRIAAGDWSRVVGPSVLDPMRTNGPTGVFLDPPYAEGEMGYSAGSVSLPDVRAWAIEVGAVPWVRVALCGYDEHDTLADAGWTPHRWKTKGGYSSQGGENANQHREVVWFSPSCLGAAQPGLFEAMGVCP